MIVIEREGEIKEDFLMKNERKKKGKKVRW